MNWLDLSAVCVAAISGNIAGRQKSMDWFGMFMIGAITGLGGGALRNVLLNVPVLFLHDGTHLLACLAGSFASFLLTPIWDQYRRIVSVIDAIALGLFCISGLQIAQNLGCSWWSSVISGVITCTFGGVLRDIARGEIPLIFRKEIYATPALIGGFLYVGLLHFSICNQQLASIISVSTITSIRLIAIRYALHQSS